jgi:hypothetical protein
MPANFDYQGHGHKTGGLQRHSIGDTYPIFVYGQETPEGTRYGVQNLTTGHIYLDARTAGYATAREAQHYANRVHMLRNAGTFIQGPIRRGGHLA